jgi:ribonucleoside-diphosphate reductase alpha chain
VEENQQQHSQHVKRKNCSMSSSPKTYTLPTPYQQYIYVSRYARFLWEEKRRETWTETVDRYITFFKKQTTGKIKASDPIWEELRDAIGNLEVMPSMRALMTAGEALERDHVAGYNCSYVAVDNTRSFDEILYVLMCGTGVGFSVEQKYVDQLPVIAEDFHETDTTIVVADSKLGWAKAFKELIHLLYGGQIPKYDTSKIRKAGEPLKTFGGRASGPEPLEQLFKFTIKLFKNASGRRLTTLEAHDLVCMIASCVVVGGVRRSALISLSDLFDDRMRDAKSGQWYLTEVQRALANNSYVAKGDMEIGVFMKEWLALYQSKSGERGIFSREASQNKAAENGRRDPKHDFGTNPCSEIILRNKQFCNLSEVVVRSDDTEETLARKVRLATIIGTLQSSLTDFRYLSRKWKENCEEERLLGVSMTGIMSNKLINGKDSNREVRTAILLNDLRDKAVEVNKEWAAKLGINQSTAVTCVKPSGTVSQLVNAPSGIHAAHSPYYVRRVRGDKKDPLAKLMAEVGIPVESDKMNPNNVNVFSFAVDASDNTTFRSDRSAVEQLNHWLLFYRDWCEHKPSITVSVKEHEWMEVGAWVYRHMDEMAGVSFLPGATTVLSPQPARRGATAIRAIRPRIAIKRDFFIVFLQ